MELVAHDLDPDQHLDADICIVGCGPAGLTIATELAAAGIDVLIIERGTSETLADPADDGATLAEPAQMVHAPIGRDVAGQPHTFAPYPLARSRGRGIGGSSWKWAWGSGEHAWRAQLPPLDAADFDAPVPGISGWPISYQDVAQHFPRAAEICGLQALSASTVDSWLAPEGVITKLYRSGSSTAFWSVAADAARASPHIRIVSGAYVLELKVTDDGSAISGLRVASKPGREFTVRANRYVLATGGIDNARMLLASRSASHSTGLGNAHDMVGRCFMEHFGIDVGFLVPHAPELLRDDRAFALRTENGELVQRKYQLDPALRTAEGLPNVVYQFSATRQTGAEIANWHAKRLPGRHALAKLRAGSAAAVREVLADAPALIRGQAALAAAKLRRLPNNAPWSLKVRANAEQYPTRSSRVALTDARDEYGVPVASLEWRIASEELAAVAASNAQLGAALRRHNVGTLYPIDVREDWTPKPGIAFHHLGTTRMSSTPADGVVDADCRVHGVGNLYVAGCSVFSTGGSANPTFTAIALAVRLARRLAPMPELVQSKGVSHPVGP